MACQMLTTENLSYNWYIILGASHRVVLLQSLQRLQD